MSSPDAGEQPSRKARRPESRLDELRGSRRRLVASADADRRAIERALHDGLQQHLVALAMYVQRAKALVDSDAPAATAVLEETATLVRQAIDEAARLALRIYPPLLESRGLAGSLRSAAEEAGVTLSADVNLARTIPAHVTAALYWTCVEALAAAPRATNVTITARNAGQVVEFEVVRTGGYAAEEVERLRDRIEALGGQMNVIEASGTARLSGWLPMGDDQALSEPSRHPRPGT